MEDVLVTIASGLTPNEIRELRIADNKSNESAWDWDKLEEELAELDSSDFDFGFDDIQGGVSDTPYTGQGATEYSEEDFGDDKFKFECPRCGFKFNP